MGVILRFRGEGCPKRRECLWDGRVEGRGVPPFWCPVPGLRSTRVGRSAVPWFSPAVVTPKDWQGRRLILTTPGVSGDATEVLSENSGYPSERKGEKPFPFSPKKFQTAKPKTGKTDEKEITVK